VRYHRFIATNKDRLLDSPEKALVLLLRSKRRVEALVGRGRRWLQRRRSAGFRPTPGPTAAPIAAAIPSIPGAAPERGQRFVLYRIVGNDLYPRHDAGQSLANLRFILEHEPALEGCEKRWLLNRIRQPEKVQELTALLDHHGYGYDLIPFEQEAFQAVPWDWEVLPEPDFLVSKAYRRLINHQPQSWEIALYRHKNNYLMNNNGARNRALELGRNLADWVLPWDGNCFLTAAGWESLRAAVHHQSSADYFHVPMLRIADNAQLLDPAFEADPKDEPQVVFAASAAERFNDAFPYGRRPKVELFWRLGLPGVWDGWLDEAWDQPRRPRLDPPPACPRAGWVARLHSGVRDSKAAAAVLSQQSRYGARNLAIKASINQALVPVGQSLNASAFAAYWRAPLLEDAQRHRLQQQAGRAQRLLSAWQQWWLQGGQPPRATAEELVSAFIHLLWSVRVLGPDPTGAAGQTLDQVGALWFAEGERGLQPRLRLLRRSLAPGRLPGTEPSVTAALQLALLSDLLASERLGADNRQPEGEWIALFVRWREQMAQQLERLVNPPWIGRRALDLQRLQLVQVLLQRHLGRPIEPSDRLLRLLSQQHPDGQQAVASSSAEATMRELILALSHQHGLLDHSLAQRLGWTAPRAPLPPLAAIPAEWS